VSPTGIPGVQPESRHSTGLGHGRGNPWVYFFIPVPIPVNTIPCIVKGMVDWSLTQYHHHQKLSHSLQAREKAKEASLEDRIASYTQYIPENTFQRDNVTTTSNNGSGYQAKKKQQQQQERQERKWKTWMDSIQP
jgi:hypothetical protein